MNKEEIEKTKDIMKTKFILLRDGINIKTTDEFSRLKEKTDYETILNYMHYLETKVKELEEEKKNAYWKGYIQKQNEAIEICKICKYRTKSKKIE